MEFTLTRGQKSPAGSNRFQQLRQASRRAHLDARRQLAQILGYFSFFPPSPVEPTLMVPRTLKGLGEGGCEFTASGAMVIVVFWTDGV